MKPAIALIIVLLSSVAYAASLSVTPPTIYETTSGWTAVDVNNYGSVELVTSVNVTSELPVQNAKNYSGWTMSHTNSSASWTNGVIAGNVRSAWFEVMLKAPKVTSDTNKTLTVRAGSNTSVLTITVLNDPTPPNITSLSPSQYARANNSAQAIQIVANDPETGVASVNYTYNNCAAGPNTVVALVEANNTFNGVADFSGYLEGSKVCYTITAENNAGEVGITQGELRFDGTPPAVTAHEPSTYVTELTTFSFTATDNIASELSCTVALGGNALANLTVQNNTQTNTTQAINASNGPDSWTVRCEDGVGLLATAIKAIIVDTISPQVGLTVPDKVPRTLAQQVTIDVTEANLASVNATFGGAQVNLSQNGSQFTGSIKSNTTGVFELIVQALDSAGHLTTMRKNITFVPNHIVTMTLNGGALEGDTVTVSGTVTGDGALVETTVTVRSPQGTQVVNITNGAYTATFTAPSAGTYPVNVTYTEGGYDYTIATTLTVGVAQQQQQQAPQYRDGIGAAAWRNNGYVKPEDADNENQEVEEEQQEEQELQEPDIEVYEPIDPDEPRQAVRPQATGLFNLGNVVKWGAILLMIGLLGALGTYAYRKMPPRKPKEGIDWDSYFNNGPRTIP